MLEPEILSAQPIQLSAGSKILLRSFSTHPVVDGSGVSLVASFLPTNFVPAPLQLGATAALWFNFSNFEVLFVEDGGAQLSSRLSDLGTLYGWVEIPNLIGTDSPRDSRRPIP